MSPNPQNMTAQIGHYSRAASPRHPLFLRAGRRRHGTGGHGGHAAVRLASAGLHHGRTAAAFSPRSTARRRVEWTEQGLQATRSS